MDDAIKLAIFEYYWNECFSNSIDEYKEITFPLLERLYKEYKLSLE